MTQYHGAPNKCALAAALVVLLAGGAAKAQTLTVLPVSIQMAPGQTVTTMTVINQGDTTTAVQVRAFSWNQPNGTDEMASSDQVLASPPLTAIAPGTAQVVRLLLRQPPQGKEATYRLLLDQIPPPAEPGTVRVALRVSIPVFAEPATRALPHVKFHIESDAGQAYLVALNDGGRHETIRDIALTTSDGRKLKTQAGLSPYVLAGATRRWTIATQGSLPAPGGTLRLTARSENGAVDQPVSVSANP